MSAMVIFAVVRFMVKIWLLLDCFCEKNDLTKGAKAY